MFSWLLPLSNDIMMMLSCYELYNDITQRQWNSVYIKEPLDANNYPLKAGTGFQILHPNPYFLYALNSARHWEHLPRPSAGCLWLGILDLFPTWHVQRRPKPAAS